jgi:hypothetical protein
MICLSFSDVGHILSQAVEVGSGFRTTTSHFIARTATSEYLLDHDDLRLIAVAYERLKNACVASLAGMDCSREVGDGVPLEAMTEKLVMVMRGTLDNAPDLLAFAADQGGKPERVAAYHARHQEETFLILIVRPAAIFLSGIEATASQAAAALCHEIAHVLQERKDGPSSVVFTPDEIASPSPEHMTAYLSDTRELEAHAVQVSLLETDGDLPLDLRSMTGGHDAATIRKAYSDAAINPALPVAFSDVVRDFSDLFVCLRRDHALKP